MFNHILLFELKYRLKKTSTYIYFAIYFLLGFLAIYRASYGSGFLTALTGAGIGNMNANAPYAIHYLVTFLSNYGLFIACAIFGNAAYREYKNNTFELYFSYPVKKIDYFAGRFMGAFLSTLIVFSGIGLGALLATISPMLTNPDKIGSLRLFSYILPYLTGTIVNLFIAGTLFFTFALLTRKLTSTYLVIVILVVAYLAAVSLMASTQNKLIPSLIDPFGMIASKSFYEYWTPAQKNILLVPLMGKFLYNRILWTCLSFMVLLFACIKFDFSNFGESSREKSKNLTTNKKSKPLSQAITYLKPTLNFNFRNYSHQMFYTIYSEFGGIVKNIYFTIILLFGIALIFLVGFKNVGLVHGIQTYPVTSQVLETIENIFYLFNLIVILFCAGELVWRERNKKVQDIYDAMPTPEWVPFIGKLGALILVQVMMMLIIMICSIIIQISLGYYHFEFGLYFKELFCIHLIYYSLVSLLAIFLLVILNKRLLGYIFTLLLVDDFMALIGLKHHLWTFAKTDFYTYSDMNGFGPFTPQLFFYNLYWISFAFILITLTLLFWVRGKDLRIKDRIRAAKMRFTRARLITGGAGLLLTLFLGGMIIYNTHGINKFETKETIEKYQADYEKKYKKYIDMHQPVITDIKLNVDLYPDQRKYRSSGQMTLLNKTDHPIEKIFVGVPNEVNVNKLNFNEPHRLVYSDRDFGIFIYEFFTPMPTKKQLTLHFDIDFAEQGFKDSNVNTSLVRNGTSLRHFHLIPGIGYNPDSELKDNDKRKKFGLAPKERIPSIDDEQAKMYCGYGRDAHWIDFEAILSTEKDQIALTSGELVKEWSDGERRYFHYKTKKINKYFPVVSAQYRMKKEHWQDVAIEIYYYQKHEYNVDRMIYALKKSFDYYSKNFSPYQFKLIRIVEFPRYDQFAESLPTIIPYSEGLGFIMKLDSKDLDFIFHVTSHELAHQWWAQQVRGAQVQGATLLSEVMAQYSSLMAFRAEFDQSKINNLVKMYLERYLKGRATETQKELPLILVENQDYIHYGKGLVVMNALQDYIGEDSLNATIRKYIRAVAFQEPPYTTSLEFLDYLKRTIPDSLKYIITDMFETITVYDNKAVKACYQELANGKYYVKFRFKAEKKRADASGNEKSIQVNDLITFDVLGLDGETLYSGKHWIKTSAGELEFVVDKMPDKVAIDPYYFLVDKKIEDNSIAVSKE